MALETSTYIDGLVVTNPVAGDPVSQADDHLRLIKSTVKTTFPNVTGAVTATHTTINAAATFVASGGAINGRAYTPPSSVAFSATPTFDASLSNVFYLGSMTANVTSITVSNAQDGQTINIRFPQDGTGGRTVALSATFKASGAQETGASRTSWLTLTYVLSALRWEGSWATVAS